MTQQTAVQWLLSELQIRLLKIKSEPDGIVRERMINSFLIDAEQAEAMEKKQIINADLNGSKRTIAGFDLTLSERRVKELAEQYYNETYNK